MVPNIVGRYIKVVVAKFSKESPESLEMIGGGWGYLWHGRWGSSGDSQGLPEEELVGDDVVVTMIGALPDTSSSWYLVVLNSFKFSPRCFWFYLYLTGVFSGIWEGGVDEVFFFCVKYNFRKVNNDARRNSR